MICSVPERKSGLNWLDKLRKSKGFPVGHDLGLEAFLDVNPPSSGEAESSGDCRSGTSSRPGTARRRSRASVPVKTVSVGRRGKTEDWCMIMSCVLADLFNMNDPRRSRVMGERKRLRKQRTPRVCTIANSGNRENRIVVNTSSSAAVSPQNNGFQMAEKALTEINAVGLRLKRNCVNGELEVTEKNEERAFFSDACMALYSCTEVTVIDSSFPGWKSQKTISREGDGWRVRDRKQRASVNATASGNTFRKKRRLNCKREREECPSISGAEDCTREAVKESQPSL